MAGPVIEEIEYFREEDLVPGSEGFTYSQFQQLNSQQLDLFLNNGTLEGVSDVVSFESPLTPGPGGEEAGPEGV